MPFDPTMIIMLVVMIGVFYFLMIRPENKRKKEAEEMKSSLKNGDKVTTIGGITGTVVNVKDRGQEGREEEAAGSQGEGRC